MLQKFEQRMFGDYCCSCGCGKPLGHLKNGLDGKPIEYTICIGDLDNDVNGYRWRSFTKECFEQVSKGRSLEAIYSSYGPAPLYEEEEYENLACHT